MPLRPLISPLGSPPVPDSHPVRPDHQNPAVSVVVPVYNRACSLRRAVESVVSASDEAVEIVVVDDGSTDESLALAERLAQERPGRVRVLRHPDGGNHGAAASRNLGIAAALGEWIAFLDSDDVYYPARFGGLHGELLRSPGVDAVYGTAEVIYADGRSAAELGWDEHCVFGITEPLVGAELLGSLLTGCVWHVSAVTVRRDLLDRSGAFDTSFKTSEDCNLWFRVASVGKAVAGDLSAPVAAYFRHSANTYYPSAAARVEFVRAIGCALSWARRSPGVHVYAMPTLQRGFRTRLLHDTMALRTTGDRRAAWRCLLLAARHDPLALVRWPLVRQLQALARESLHLSAGPARQSAP